MFLSTDNQFTSRGRLVKEAVINISENGNAIASITLAQKKPFKIEGEFETVYINYTAIDTKTNDIATRLAKYTTKGSLISLVGYLDSYVKEDKEGKKYISVNRISAFRTEESKEETEARRKENISEK
ncbi:MAG: single-stranded DNA-binding protein [Mammaliicoccus vitulinus]